MDRSGDDGDVGQTSRLHYSMIGQVGTVPVIPSIFEVFFSKTLTTTCMKLMCGLHLYNEKKIRGGGIYLNLGA